MIIKNGNIHDAINREAYVADIALRDGKIAAIGKDIAPLAGEEIFDAAGKEVYPGLVEAHCHIGLHGFGVGQESNDVNENSDNVGAQNRAIDGFNPRDEYLKCALEAGITTICTGPGSGNIITGTFVATKTYGTCIDDMAIVPNVAMKVAFGQNPKNPKKKTVTTRMGIAAKMRQTLYDAKDYMMKKEAAGDDFAKRPKMDLKLEALIPVLKGEMPLKAHVHRADDICTAIRIAKEFGVKMTLEHVTDGRNVVKELVRAGYPVALGPSLYPTTKNEVYNKSFKTAAVLDEAGLKVSIITDAPCTPPEYLALCASLAVKDGMDPFKALQAITITAAEHIGVSDRVGSLEVGKDADVVIADGDILISSTNVETVFLEGEKVVG